MIKILLSLTVLSGYAMASGGEGGTDIVWRTFNFLIFVGILYYLLANPVKSFFKGRSAGIAAELERVQEKLKESKLTKERALKKVDEAQKVAADLLETSKKENKILSEQIVRQCEADIENITKQHHSLMDLEQRKMVRTVVDTVMRDLLQQESDGFDKDAMAQIVLKKVA
ncbi:MAG: F0F1 ATP synthase subunit B [Campylobacterales bacterium]|nr:F0F1 ATP synthase subunit B [Campylobacterales bacterium]